MTEREFTNYFESTVRPKYETNIRKYINTKKRFTFIFLGLFAFVMTPVIILSNMLPDTFSAFILVLIAGFLGIILFGIIVANTNTAKKMGQLILIKNEMLNELVTITLPGFTYNNENGLSEDEFRKHSIISPINLNDFRSEDAISGSVNGKNVKISELSTFTSSGNNRNRTLIFKGFAAEIDMDLDPTFELTVTRKRYCSGSLIKTVSANGNPSSPISITHPYFEQNYYIMTNDEVKANTLLQPYVLDRLQKVMEDSGKKFSFDIFDGKILILLENKRNAFDFKDMSNFNPQVLWEDLKTAIDTVLVLEKSGLDFKKLSKPI